MAVKDPEKKDAATDTGNVALEPSPAAPGESAPAAPLREQALPR